MLIFAILLGVLPSLIWLVFFLKEDDHPEPKKKLARVFIWGMIVAFMAVVFQIFFKDILSFFKIGEFDFFSFLVLGAVEEILKFLVVYATVKGDKDFDEPVDAMIYMITVALGFAALENIFLAASAFIDNGWRDGGIYGLLVIRFNGATLLHALSSAIVGYYWAKGLLKINPPAGGWKLKIITGLIIASFLHGFFNYLILISSKISILSMLLYPLFLLIIIALVVFKDFDKIKK